MSAFRKAGSFLRLFKQAVRGEQQDYTRLGVDKAIFMLSIPMILEMVMESLFAVVDVYFVSKLNDNDAVATVGLTESVLTLVYSIAIGLSMGATAMVARRVGEKDVKAAAVAGVQALYIGISISVAITVVGIFFSGDVLRLMGASEALIRHNVGYTQWMLTGNVTIMMLFLINAIFRGAGDASLAMRSLWLANILNMVLDPILIFGLGPIPAFGVEGAAMATTLGRGCGVAYQCYHLARGNGLLKLSASNVGFRPEIVVRLIKVSAGGMAQFLISSASWIFLVRIVSSFGSAPVAGYTIAIRLIVFAILPAWGMANASATLVGQNPGAGEPDRAERSVWRAAFLNMMFLGAVGLLFIFFARPMLMFFTTDSEVLFHGMRCLQIVCLGYAFYAYGMVIIQSFNGAGDTRTPTLINLVGFWLFQIPLAYLLAMVMETGSSGVYVAIATAESAIAIAAIVLFRKGKWKVVRI